MIKNLRLVLVTVFLLLLSLNGFSQACTGSQLTLSIQNITNPTPTTLEYDVYIKNTGTTTVKLSSYGGCVRFPATMLGGGTGTLTVIDQPSAGAFPGLSPIVPSLNGPTQQARWTNTPPITEPAAVPMPIGVDMKFARFRITNSIPWAANYPAQLYFSTGGTGISLNLPIVYCGGNTTSTVISLANTNLVLLTPPVIILNPCPTTGTVTSSTPADCFGDTNGAVTIALTPTPTFTGVTYVVDGSSTTLTGTLITGGSLIVGNLTAGSHSIAITGTTPCTTPIIVPVTIGGPTVQPTNTTTITSCDSYTWPVTGLAYTTGGTYSGTSTDANGCSVNETLNLTINNSTSGTTTATACDTYTWALPLGTGTAYTTSQPSITNVTTNAAGCPHTETLNLTINNSTSGTTNATGCDTYTWALPLGTGATYTTNQTNLTNVTTNAAGCNHTQTLNLTLGTTTSSVINATACDTYTWALPLGTGTAYTTSQPGITNTTTNASGCPHTETLNLTINNSTSGITNATACDSYTWALPLGTGNTYTTSQPSLTNVTTNAAGCPHTQTLNLTLGNSSSGTTNATACDTYTWALPLGTGVTYTSNQTSLNNVTTNASGCQHTQTLNLTINNSTTSTITTTACGTYTWALPLGTGLAYTTNQPGITNVTTNAAGCPHTETLNLTITSNSSGTTNATACSSYTWAGPLGNGVTYTTSQTSITNVTTNAAGCTHTQTLNLTINNPTTGTTNATACDTYTWAGPLGNGVTYTTSQASVTFVSTNAAGCSHTQTLNLTINNSTSGITTATACDSYTWAGPLGNGAAYTSSVSGVNYVTTNAAGCPHTQTLNLTINNSTSGVTNASACNTYTWAGPLGTGLAYTTNQVGLANVTTNAAGCPHTQTLNLIINTPTTGTTTASTCNSYTWAAPLGNGLTYTTSQNGITHISTNANGCQHTQTLNLTVNSSTTGTNNVTACNTYTWALPQGNGQTYTSSVSGVTHISTNANGCPNTQTLNLTINNTSSGTTNVVTCDGYTWAGPLGNGQTYTSSVSGVTHISTNASGCPHTETLNLTINYSTSGITNATACDSYTWAAPLGTGLTYTTNQAGITNVTTNAAGCSHTQMLNLTINSSTSGTTNATACDSYTWAFPFGNGQTYTTNQTSLTHSSTNTYGCPHTQTLNLTINNSTSGITTATACDNYTWALPLGNGLTYTSSVTGLTKITTNANGCPHTQTLNLTINNSTSGTTTVSACDSYTWAGPLGNGLTYTTSQNGIAFVTTNAAGCTHTQTLNLTMHISTTGTSNVIACGTYTWAPPLGNGQTYTASVSGVTNVSTNAGGCPHTETLNLTIGQNTTFGSLTTTAINTYTWAANGVTYTTSGTYTYVTTTSTGCTNTATLNLTIISVTGTTWYQDLDGDGYGNPSVTVTAPVAPPGYVAIGTDCDDNNATTNPGAIEVCYDGIDNDCNGVIDNIGQPGGCIAIVTSLMPASCGATLSTLRDKLTAHYVIGAQGYRFRIKNLATNVVVVRDRPLNWILLSDLSSANPGFVTFNATYRIDIALLIGNVWQPTYGAACNVTTPTPTSTIGAHCGTTLTAMNQWIYTTYNSTATGYRFRITNTADGSVQILDQVLNRFNFSQLPVSAPNTIYTVEVALKNTDGTYMPYGPGCNITTGSSRIVADIAVGEFKVIAYPNPFAEDFKLDIRTSSESGLQIRVYDMLGKQIENRDVPLSDVQNLEIGANYPSGVYNVIVTQQGTTQTLRVIKR